MVFFENMQSFIWANVPGTASHFSLPVFRPGQCSKYCLPFRSPCFSTGAMFQVLPLISGSLFFDRGNVPSTAFHFSLLVFRSGRCSKYCLSFQSPCFSGHACWAAPTGFKPSYTWCRSLSATASCWSSWLTTSGSVLPLSLAPDWAISSLAGGEPWSLTWTSTVTDMDILKWSVYLKTSIFEEKINCVGGGSEPFPLKKGSKSFCLSCYLSKNLCRLNFTGIKNIFLNCFIW